jgi:ATPase subunit of ABC transporter with duplicated ATPase domains
MAGRPVVAEVMAGAGAVSEVAAELKRLEDADPAQAEKMDTRSAFGEAGPVRRARRLRARGPGARSGGLGFPRRMHGDVGNLSGGWKMSFWRGSC